MRVYSENKKKEIISLVCNNCKKQIPVDQGIVKEGYFSGETIFGYFSHKDGQKHSFDLCEDCYDEIVAGFQIPEQVEAMKELL